MELSTKLRDVNDLTTFLLLWKSHQSIMQSETEDIKYVDAYAFPEQPRLAFCDSEEKDALLARHFWLSIHLRPFTESRLVSSDIRQRTMKASIKSQEDQRIISDNQFHKRKHDFGR